MQFIISKVFTYCPEKHLGATQLYKILNSELLWKITGADIQVSSEVRVDNILAKAHLVLRPSWCSDILFIKGAQGYQNLTEFKRIHIIGQIHGLGLRVFA